MECDVDNKIEQKIDLFIQAFLTCNQVDAENLFVFQKNSIQEYEQLINTQNNLLFVAALMECLRNKKITALFNPLWLSEKQKIVKSQSKVLSSLSIDIDVSKPKLEEEAVFLIPTGGTSGEIKLVIHDFLRISTSVSGFRNFFGLERVNCFCVLPLYHVSGFMQVMRSLLSEGSFYLGDYGSLKRGILPEGDFSDFCISLVPTQLQVLLDVCPEWLQQFRLILIGGAPAWRSLLEKAREYQLNIALTYGMTETASQVVALKPEDFLAGKNCAGQVLPHAKVNLDEDGLISIEAKSLFHGYYPELRGDRPFVTDDIGYFDDEGFLHIVGRKSQKIISGGENIYPNEIEATIQATGMVSDVAVCGMPDEYWGEAVTAVIVLKSGATSEEVKTAIANRLSRYKLPKLWLCVSKLPRNAQGKLNRTILREMIEKDYQSEES
ncbi:o-succinylbenzoate--CoA ligase [[Leptolyngbya] sp. PCC 7376]|uniref:AMP-binding protein n=1 Tax=[Leptolyngbya] sp. PCC 7376 TaxID=111781 RepID=UPI00029EF45B|nr:AMP-binding protein [[Leptolyngbya] sp. PCC 7376]AFY36562.1 o-succinylbenzoate--CoA ligase [[Leptolyngbya] sp. PCC 7376]